MLLIQTAFAQEFAAVKRACRSMRLHSERCVVLMTGMGSRAARTAVQRYLENIERPRAVLTLGLAGGLRSDLKLGDHGLIGQVQELVDGRDPSEPLRAHNHLFSPNLLAGRSVFKLVTVAQAAFTSQAKTQLAERCGACVCDMETYAVADVCRQWQLPWVGARIVSDTLGESMQPWIGQLPELMAQRKWRKMVQLIATHPQDLPSLLRLAIRMQTLEKQLTQLTIDLVTHVPPA